MKVPLSWLREYADLPAVTAHEVADKLTAAGLKLEAITSHGHDVKNVVVGEVLEIEELTGFKKPIRHCRVDTAEAEPRMIVCGATNFVVGDRVPVVLPGGVLPGGFEVGARKTYGRMSEGMICSERELGLGEDHNGIMVLPAGTPLGADVVELLQLRDDVIELEITPDIGYALSIRGVAREAATAFGVAFRDPADVELPAATGPAWPASIADPTACDRFVLREATGFDPAAESPLWMRVRLTRAGMRPVSLAVDVTNYLMLELGQPLHAFDRAKLTGEIVVRRAAPGERLETLDHVVRELDPDDILITDQSGPLSLAGTMGGLQTEISADTTDIVVEAAHFSATGISRGSRRHGLVSESSKRFERGVDRELPLVASWKAVRMLAELGGATVQPGLTHTEIEVSPPRIAIPASHPGAVAGVPYTTETVVARLEQVGCVVTDGADPAVRRGGVDPTGVVTGGELAAKLAVTGDDMITVTPPSWRPDLTDPNDLAEEVIRLEGYENLPSVLPSAPAGAGLTEGQRLRRRVGRALAEGGYVEVLSYPFISSADFDRLLLPADDARRSAMRLANPLSEDEPLLRTTLLPGLLKTLVRNAGRGFTDVALFETGSVYRPREDAPEAAPVFGVERRPTEEELASIEAALPDQPLRVAVVLAGEFERSGWWGAGRAASWADAVQAARLVAGEARVELSISADQHEPWHPGRCAALYVGDTLVGHAGELHPRVIEAYGLPPRTAAMELELSRLESVMPGPVETPAVSAYPVATQDVALIVPDFTPVADVEAALRDGAGELLESIRLFDVYAGEQVGEGNKSLAYTMRFRASDRTLTVEETTAARDAAVAVAADRVGAQLRSS
ncbi:phenylalanyl-tRNA synthetase beta chain [Nonomuraea maritima]|uniref:Phenylalanine--tRNA ligase beta subunit n=1 Tax=Nonomuraea maritima TaxID=683260 RepID=A0A1G8XM60_9ACTN|nr:phenylalanine--tRNA ligase subunit beta [Nonomuraea maritima]SDJ91244.1 phenylalanyl-tRNA synthetase beta chain [Nonomuraea maritima]